MSKTLYVPEYIAKQKEQLKQKPPPKKTEVEAPALEKLPKPTEVVNWLLARKITSYPLGI